MPRATLLATAVVFLAAFVVLGIVAAPGPLPIDLTASSTLAPLRDGAIGAVIAAVNLLGESLVWDPLVGLLALILWLRGHRMAAVVLVVGLLGAEAAASVAKIVIGRGRPPGVQVVDLITQASYPSGHVTRTVVTGGLLAALAWSGARRWHAVLAVAVVVAVVVMGISRVAVGEHWFTDVVGAVLFGVGALAVVGLVMPFLERPLTRPGVARTMPPS